MVNLELYKVFYEVAKTGSLTKAAQELNRSQPAVSQAIKSLETQLGGKLFNRVSRGMELTETGGKQLFESVKEAMRIMNGAERKYIEMQNSPSGLLRICASNAVFTHFLMRYIKKYHETYPNVTITMKNSTSGESIDLVRSGKSDIGFVNLPLNDDSVLLTGQTGEMEVIFVASEKYSELFGKTVALKEIENYPVIMLETSTVSSKEIYAFCDSVNVQIKPEFEVSSIELLIEMAKSGLGLACVPRRYVLEQLENAELFELKVTPALPVRYIGVVVTKDVDSHTFAMKEFLRLLDENQYE